MKRKLPPNPLPVPGNVTPTVGVEVDERTERRVPARMKPGEIPLAEGRLLMPWYLMWPDYDG